MANAKKRKNPRNLRPERFGDRVKWCIRHLEPDEIIIGEQPFGHPGPAAISDGQSLWKQISRILKQDPESASKTWRRAIQPNSPSVPEAFIYALTRIYPEVPAEVWSAPRYSEFEAGIAKIKAQRERWITATRYVTGNRQKLADAGKQYYISVDEVPSFPLIAKSDWILETPQELTEGDALPGQDIFLKDPKAPMLPGLGIPYRNIALHALGKERLRWNGDSYRVACTRF